MTERFDAIVVGAGPAGCTAALVLSRAGLRVAIFERGEYAGAKNMFGGALYYSDVLNQLLPDFWEEAPVERYVTKRVITFLTPSSCLSIDFKNAEFAQPPYNGLTILRAKFDKWYAQKAEEAGALLVPETVIDDLLWENNKVIGIRARRDEGVAMANVVIVADGANSLLVKKAGLRREFAPAQVAVAAKEVLALPSDTIAERFNLIGNEGVANEFVGSCTDGVEGGGFLYTNKASLSIGIVANLSSLQQYKVSVADLLERFKEHPCIRPLLKGAALKEYSGHLIPEGGIDMVPRLYDNGILVVGDAAGLVLSTGLSFEGMNFAIASGYAAAETVIKARDREDFSKRSLSYYRTLLERSFVLRDLKTFRRAHKMLSNPRLYSTYPSIACGVTRRLFTVDGGPKRKLLSLARSEMKGGGVSLRQLARDGIEIWRGLLWP